MKLYYTKGACSMVVRIIINELGLTCAYESVDLKTKRTEKDEDFLKINPKGAVPTFVTDDGKILTENAVILQYLADTQHNTQLLPALGNFKRYRVLEWLNYITTELHKSFGALFNASFPQDLKENFFIPMLKTKFAYVDKQLTQQFLLGDEFTLPDAYLYVMLRWAQHFKFDIQAWPHLARYFEVLNKRKSIQQALSEEGLS